MLFGKKEKRNPRDLFYVELSSSLEKPGCPICGIVEKVEYDLVFDILYEHVNDPDTRSKFRESLGLCGYHAWLLYKYSYGDPLIGEPGPAIIYQDMLETYYEMLEKKGIVNPAKFSGKCFLCKDLVEYNRIFVEKFAEKIIETDLLQEYEANTYSILCMHHFRDVYMELLKKRKDLAEKLREIQLHKISKLLDIMKKFINKFDYRVKEQPTSIEATSTKLAIQALKGTPTTTRIYNCKTNPNT